MRGTYERRTWTANLELYAPARYRRACTYEVFLPTHLRDTPVDLPGDVAGVVSDAEAAILRLNARAHPALQPLARILLRTESIASSKVEGLQIDGRDLARAEVRSETGARVAPTAAEVLANIDAMQLAVDAAADTDSMTVERICDIHRRLMQAAAPGIAGNLREQQNWIGGNDYNPCGADFVPAPPERIAPLLEDLCDAMSDDALPAVVQAAIAHAQFETIHPFDDGNGRTGRALIHVILRRRGLATEYVPPISVVLAQSRDRYIEGLTAFRGGDDAQWIEQFSAAAARAAGLASDYLDAVARLQDRWRSQLAAGANPRADAAAWAIIDVLPGFPAITAPVAAAATGRAKAAIHRALEQLQDCGVLVPLAAVRRNRSWEAGGLLDLQADLEAGRSAR